MTCRLPLLLLLLGALLAATTVTSASPMPQSSGDAGRTPAKAVQKSKPTAVRGTSAEKKSATSSRGDSAKVESVAERPVVKPAAGTTTKRPAGETTTKSGSQPTKRQPAAAEKSRPVAATSATEATAKATKTKTPATEATTKATKTKTPASSAPMKATKTKAPATEPPTVTERINSRGQPTTSRPGFTGDEVIPAPVCSLIITSSLISGKFVRHYLHGSTTCRCQSTHQADCRFTTLYPTVRPGSASAVHAQEQSGGTAASSAVLAANVWALRQDCRQRGLGGTVCHFGVFNQEPYCDCAVKA